MWKYRERLFQIIKSKNVSNSIIMNCCMNIQKLVQQLKYLKKLLFFQNKTPCYGIQC